MTARGYDRLVAQKQRRQVTKTAVETEVFQPAPAPMPPPSSHVDGAATWPEKPSCMFLSGIRDDAERTANGFWAEGTSPKGFEHLLPKPTDEDNPIIYS